MWQDLLLDGQLDSLAGDGGSHREVEGREDVPVSRTGLGGLVTTGLLPMSGIPVAKVGPHSFCASLRKKPPFAEGSGHRWGCVCFGQAATARPAPLRVLTGLGHAQNHVWSKGPGLLQVTGMSMHGSRCWGSERSPCSHPSPSVHPGGTRGSLAQMVMQRLPSATMP